MVTISDEDILAYLATKSNFEKGFRLLMQKYQERLYWHIRRMVGTHDDADDVIQNTFIKVYRNIQKFEKKSKLYTWLYRIATNETLTFLKKRDRHNTSSIDDEDNTIMYSLKSEVQVEAETVQQQLEKALEQLPDKQRLVFNMRYYEEMPYQQIADILKTSVGGSKANYHHAVKKIEAFIKGN